MHFIPHMLAYVGIFNLKCNFEGTDTDVTPKSWTDY